MTIEFPCTHRPKVFLLQFSLYIFITFHSSDNNNDMKKKARNKKIHTVEILWTVIIFNDSYEKYMKSINQCSHVHMPYMKYVYFDADTI